MVMDFEGFPSPVAGDRRSLSGFRKSLSTPVAIATNLNPRVVLSDVCDALNDDDEERRVRQLDRVRELHRIVLSSPATPAERRQSLTNVVPELTNVQLSEHYSSCMKLSAENKITIKNAFGLHLIDYMSQLLKKTDDGSTNFQMASCTLDASAKIYSYRVDCIHADVYKMAGGLGLAEEPKNTAEPGDDEMPDDAERTVKKKKKTKKSATVETNVKALNISKLELGFQADALFLKMSRAFEEGGINGLLFNTAARNDSSELLLDASAPYRCANEPRECSLLSVPKDIMGPLYKLKTCEEVQICPSLSNFSFMDKNTFMEDEDDDVSRKKTGHTFDLDSVPEPIEEDIPDDIEVGMDSDDSQMSDDETAMDQGMAVDFTVTDSNTVRMNHAARSSGDSVNAVRVESVADLTCALAEAPSEYSYFDHNLLTVWAGPNHWRLRPFSKSKSSLIPPQKVSGKKNKRKKAEVLLDFHEVDKIKDDDFVPIFDKAKLLKATLKTWNPEKNTLPEDLFYDPKQLCILSHIDIVMSLGSKHQTDVSGQVGQDKLDNANNKENCCPDAASSRDDDDDDDDSAAYPATSPGRHSSVLQDRTNNESGDAYTGSNLVELPQKVEKVRIGYAQTSKKIDAKRLKQAMWSVLARRGTENKGNVDQNEPCPTKLKDPMKFSELYHSLPSKVSSNVAKNLSIPVAFVCLLHVANEKNLDLVGQADMKDFTIMQG